MQFVDWHIFDSADCQLPVPSLLWLFSQPAQKTGQGPSRPGHLHRKGDGAFTTFIIGGSLRGIHDIPVQIQMSIQVIQYVWVWSGRISMQNLLDVSGIVFNASRWWRLQKGTCYGACFCFCFFFLPRLPSSCSLQLKSMAQSKATCRTGSCNSITQPEMHCAHLDRPQAYQHGHCTTIPEGLTVSHHSQHPEAKLSIFSSTKKKEPSRQAN